MFWAVSVTLKQCIVYFVFRLKFFVRLSTEFLISRSGSFFEKLPPAESGRQRIAKIAGFVEKFAARLGFEAPRLSKAQEDVPRAALMTGGYRPAPSPQP